jgi:hypothetical protein
MHLERWRGVSAAVLMAVCLLGTHGCQGKQRPFGVTSERPGGVDDNESPASSDRDDPGDERPGDTASDPASDTPENEAKLPAATPGSGAIDAGACAGLPLSRCECAVGETTSCRAEYASFGVCGDRTIECQMPGTWPPGDACLPTSEELCTPGQLDEDCDGSVDEGCECIDGTQEGCGNQSSGVRTCAAGLWGTCLCPGEQAIDVDENAIADANETLIDNGSFSTDLSGWDVLVNELPYTQFVREDADALTCSGAMQLMTAESGTRVGTGLFTWVTNQAQRCIATTVSSVAAFAEVRLLMNTGDYNGSLEATGVDPSIVSLDLWSYGTANCSGDPVSAQNQLFELPTDGSWQRLSGSLVAGSATQSLLVRWSVVGDGVDGEQSTGVRLVQFDNMLLRPL